MYAWARIFSRSLPIFSSRSAAFEKRRPSGRAGERRCSSCGALTAAVITKLRLSKVNFAPADTLVALVLDDTTLNSSIFRCGQNNHLRPAAAYFCAQRKTEQFCVDSPPPVTISVTGGGKMTLDRLGLVITAAVNAPQLEQHQNSPSAGGGRISARVQNGVVLLRIVPNQGHQRDRRWQIGLRLPALGRSRACYRPTARAAPGGGAEEMDKKRG